ncbi:hypothetical protein B566_EDAN014596 [Ephemera danica]|nr:hypothetical protein B566_EDAN014596 [Ephemera danica]
MELEVANIHQSHQELMQSSDRREKLERAARQRLQEENRLLRHQYELLLSQLESCPSSGLSGSSGSSEAILQLRQEIAHRDSLLTQLMAQNKDLTGCRERQEIELAAQRATLQEQRTHIDILDAALNNAQANVMRLEEECRKRQLYEERVVQLQQSLSSLQLAREQLEGEINDLRVSRHEKSGSEDSAELLQKLRDRDEQLLSLEKEVSRWQQWYMEENTLRQAVIDAASIPLDAKIAALEKTSQESERLMAEARSDKIRQLDELHAAQRKIADLESRSQELESRLAEKEAMIKVLQTAHQHHHSSLIPTSSGGSNPPLSRASPHHHLHHSSYSSSSFYRQPSPSSIVLPRNAPRGKSKEQSCNLSGSETDVSTSTENLSQEERYVIKHMPRQEPQGQEKQEPNDTLPHSLCLNSLDSASSYNTLIIHTTGEDGTEPWSALTPSSHSKATSVPSSSPSSSPTLSGVTTSGNGAGPGHSSHYRQQLRDITDIPDDYLSESQVLKHLAKEVKVVSSDCLMKNADDSVAPRRLLLLDLTPTVHSRLVSHRYSTPLAQSATLRQSKLTQSRSQPDLSQLDEGCTESESAPNVTHRPKTRGRELESCPSSGLSGSSGSSEAILQLRQEIAHRDSLLTQLMAQNKDLTGCRERQEIELAAQRATLQEQRTHIDILDAALNNAQANVMRLEEECRKRQLYEERVVQLQQSLSSLQLAREQLEGEINDLRVSRHEKSGSEDSAELLQKLRDRDEQLLSLEKEVSRWQQWYMEENTLRQAVIDAASIPLDAKIAALEKTSQESERLMAEARSDKIRQLDELHAAQRKIADLESRSQELESRLAEKEAMIKVLQTAHQHHHSSLIPTSSGGSNPPLSRASPHHHLHHSSYSSSSFYRQPSPSSIGGTISSGSMLGSLGQTPGSMIPTSLMSTSNVSTPTSRTGFSRNLSNLRTTNSGLSFSHKTDYGSGSSAGPASTISSCSTSPLVAGHSSTKEGKMLDEQLQNIDSQLLSGGSIIGALQQEKKDYPNHYWWLSEQFQPAPKSQHYRDQVEMQEISAPDTVHRNSPKSYNVARSGSSGSGRQSTCSFSPNSSLPPTPSPASKEKHETTRFFSYSSSTSKCPLPSSGSSPVHKNTNSDILSGKYGKSSTLDEGEHKLYKKTSANNVFNLHSPASSRCTSNDHAERYLKSSSCYENSKTNNEILLLEKQGRSSQKQRRSSAGSQASSDDTKPLCSLTRANKPSLPKPETRKVFRRTQGGYNRLEESTSHENLNNPNVERESPSKLAQQQSRKSSPDAMAALNRKTSSYERLGSGVKYRIHL